MVHSRGGGKSNTTERSEGGHQHGGQQRHGPIPQPLPSLTLGKQSDLWAYCLRNGMSIFLCLIYKLNEWFSVVDHPVRKKKSTLSVLQQLRVVISPGPSVAPFRVLLKGQQCDLPAGALCESLRTRRRDSPPGTRSILTAIFSLRLLWLQAKLSMRSITPK